MSDKRENEDKLGAALVQVHHDLSQLKCSIEKVSANVSDRATTLDVQALDNAICRAHSSIRKHAEDYMKTVNKQQLVLPSIEDVQKQMLKTPKWKPPLESLPDVHPQRKELLGALPRIKLSQDRIDYLFQHANKTAVASPTANHWLSACCRLLQLGPAPFCSILVPGNEIFAF
ncbi:IQ motif-containing protein H-like [Kryptolebias marmoratus]|uniref:IQ motif-containing protein H-like n=1 Tax=Kryptolebias marmoratus TaxID=37003 RepID=UPI0018ACB961|nr:IQ motif-containing protein H-like [Kryptolebias marmoratus]